MPHGLVYPFGHQGVLLSDLQGDGPVAPQILVSPAEQIESTREQGGAEDRLPNLDRVVSEAQCIGENIQAGHDSQSCRRDRHQNEFARAIWTSNLGDASCPARMRI